MRAMLSIERLRRTALPRAIDAALMGQAAALSLGRLRRVESLQTMILLIYSTAEKSNPVGGLLPALPEA
jgi:hypothetical protein